MNLLYSLFCADTIRLCVFSLSTCGYRPGFLVYAKPVKEGRKDLPLLLVHHSPWHVGSEYHGSKLRDDIIPEVHVSENLNQLCIRFLPSTRTAEGDLVLLLPQVCMGAFWGGFAFHSLMFHMRFFEHLDLPSTMDIYGTRLGLTLRMEKPHTALVR